MGWLQLFDFTNPPQAIFVSLREAAQERENFHEPGQSSL
jgi:hypothetical protein